MKPLRLLCITRAWSENAGGMERLSFELLQELQKLPETAVTSIKRQGTSRLGAIIFVLTSLPQALIKARRADVIHLGDPVLALHGWLIKKIFQKPVAVTIHGLDVTYANPLYQVYLKLFAQFDLCFPISQYAESLLKKSVVRCQSSVVIRPGIYDQYFEPSINRDDLATFLQKTTNYKLQPTASVLGTIGRLVKRKGHAWFIKNILPSLQKNTVYIIAGDGPEKETLQNLAQNNSQVLLLGRVSDAELKILYNTIDAFIQPNIPIKGDAEGFGLVLLEAALCQRSVFATNLDGIHDAIHQGHNGTLLPAGDVAAWITALNQPLSVNQQVRTYTLQNFSWSATAAKYRAALSKIVR